MDPNQSFPEFGNVEPPNFGGAPATGGPAAPGAPQSAAPPGPGQATAQPPGFPGQNTPPPDFGALGGATGDGNTALGSLGEVGDDKKKRMQLIIIGGIVATVVSVLFVFLYFYMQGDAFAEDDLYTPPPVQPVPDRVATDEAGIPDAAGDPTADPTATNDATLDETDGTDSDSGADAETGPNEGTDLGAEPADPVLFSDSDYYTIELPENWEISSADPGDLFIEEYDFQITVPVGNEEVPVGIVKIQVSDQLLAPQIDEERYEILEERNVLIDGNSAVQTEFVDSEVEDAIPVTMLLFSANSLTYRITFTINPEFEAAPLHRNAFVESLLSMRIGDGGGSQTGGTSQQSSGNPQEDEPDGGDTDPVDEDGPDQSDLDGNDGQPGDNIIPTAEPRPTRELQTVR